MNVAELIELLSEFPSDVLVVVEGSESCGYEDVAKVCVEKIMLRGYDSSLGRYEDFLDYQVAEPEQPVINAILISKRGDK